jgi:hypothetical protein
LEKILDYSVAFFQSSRSKDVLCVRSIWLALNSYSTNLRPTSRTKKSSNESDSSNFKKKKEAAEKVKITINMENNDPYNVPLTEEELDNTLHECKGSSLGPDDTHYEFLKRMDTRERLKLLEMYQKIWSERECL